MKAKKIDMVNGPLLRSIISFTIPIILTGVLQLFFTAADLMVVGRYCGSNSVGAVGSTTSLIHLIINVFIGVSMGVGVCTAQALGAKDDEAVSKTVHTAIPTAIICGVFLTIFGYFNCEALLRLMSSPEELLELSSLYCRIYFLGMLATMLYNFGAAILRAAGDSRSPLIFLTISGVLNVVLNLIFVIIFHLDVAGVALATIISQYLSAILVMISLFKRKDACKLTLKALKIHGCVLGKILRVGVPAGIQSSLFSISNVIIQSSVNTFGNIAVSGCAAASNVEGFTYTVMNSFYQTSLNFTGQNAGAGDYKRSLKVLKLCCVLVSACGIVMGFLTFAFAKPLLGIYITDSAEAISYGVIKLTYIGLPYFICGLMEVTTGGIRGMGVSTPPMFISILGVCGVRLLWIFTVFTDPRWHSLESLFFSYPISWFATFIGQIIIYFVIYKNRLHFNPMRKDLTS